MLYNYLGGKAKSKVWLFFAFSKIKPGPPTKEKHDISKRIVAFAKRLTQDRYTVTRSQVMTKNGCRMNPYLIDQKIFLNKHLLVDSY